MIASSPSQKPGMAFRTSASVVMIASAGRPRRSAAIPPRNAPSDEDRKIADSIIIIVLGSLSMITAPTGREKLKE